jgi:very-short-patch-repair endonuclease
MGKMITEPLLKALALAPGPQTAAELRDSARRSGHKVEEFEVIRDLRQLQSQGVVRLEGTRWRLLKMPAGIATTPTSKRSVQFPSSGTGTTANAPTMKVGPAAVAPLPASSGRWVKFRAMCRYYMDCLLQDEAPRLRAYIENEDDTWIAVQQAPWARLAAGGDFAISLAREQAPFQRNRVRRGEDECVYLCYPIILVKPKDVPGFVVPLFAQPMTADWRGGALHLEPDGPIAVNGAWLEYRFRQRAERSAFLRAVGFLNDDQGEEDTSERTTPGPRDFARLAQDAALYVHDSDKFAEHVDPLALSNVTDWKKAEPGLYNAAVLTLGPRLRYTRSLLRDLRDITEKFSDEELDRTALAALFPNNEPPAQRNASITPTVDAAAPSPLFTADQVAQTRLLHPSQRTAVLNSLAAPVSVVTGPPGTGKSEVVAAILLNQLLRGQATLFASKNHQALEAVLPRLNSAVEGGDLIIQTSSRELAQRQNYLAKLQNLLARPSRPDAAQGEDYSRQFEALFRQQNTALADIAALEQARKEYEALNAELEGLRKSLPLAVQSDDRLASWPREGTRDHVEALEMELRRAFAPPFGPFQKLWHLIRRSRIEARRQAARVPLLPLPNPFADRPLPESNATGQDWNDFFTTWKAWAEAARLVALVRSCERCVAQLPLTEDCNRRMADAQQAIEKLTVEWMRWAAGGLPNSLAPADREALANLRAGIQNWGADRFGKELKRHFPLVMRAFPLWSVSNLSARSALPLLSGMFDLVIIDEASQSDIPSVIPLLARSKRAVFAGDPMQLKHVSTLDAVLDQTLLEQHGLTEPEVQRFTYRVNSAFDLADASASVPDAARARLNLHFRSHDLIADYCNEAFYAKTLHVVTMSERLNIPRGMQPGIHWTHIIGKLEPGQTGVWCADEIEAVRSELSRLAASGYRGTIGVVTPFRQQMIRLKDALATGDALPPDFMERVRFLASTAHGFQGDERDLILFSLCGGPDMPEGATIFLRENPNLFNVAVSRARAILHVVGNRDWALECGVSFIQKLARRTLPQATAQRAITREPYQSPWEKILADALTQAGVKVVPQYPIAGRFLDLAVVDPIKVDVEVDGEAFHRTAGGGRKDDDHWRDLQLQSLGWKVCRFWVYELREDLPQCVRKVAKLLGGSSITEEVTGGSGIGPERA